MSTGLIRVRELARQDKSIRFTQLFHLITHARLALHFEQLNKRAAPGVDGVYWADYRENLSDNIFNLVEKLHKGCYRPLPSRRVYIPKGKDSKRPLGIVAVEDKVLQHVVADILEKIYEEDFHDFSYGFRPERGCHDALDFLSVAIERKKVNWILDADIRKYFDSISHKHLMSFLERRIGDSRLLRLIRKWLNAGVLEGGQWSTNDAGVPQGGVISPLLANVFLHYVPDDWADRWRKSAKGEVIFVRYADDFVMGFQYEHEANEFLFILKQRLEQFGLSLHQDKTRLIEFGRFAAEKRKRRGLGKPETFDFLGFTHMAGVTRKGWFKVVRKTAAERMKNKLRALKVELRARRHHKIEDVAVWLERVVRGYFNYFAIHDNLQVLSAFSYQLGIIWYRAICGRGQRRRMTWRQFIDRWWGRIP
jgi:group II intron reverse transcriptase/maturase